MIRYTSQEFNDFSCVEKTKKLPWRRKTQAHQIL